MPVRTRVTVLFTGRFLLLCESPTCSDILAPKAWVDIWKVGELCKKEGTQNVGMSRKQIIVEC